MDDITRRTCLAAAALAPIAVGALARPSRSDDNVTSRDVIRDRYFPNLVLTTHEGRRGRVFPNPIQDKNPPDQIIVPPPEGAPSSATPAAPAPRAALRPDPCRA